MSLIDLASLVLAPTATKEGKVYSAIPDTGDGDMTFTRGSSATRVNSAGLIEKERGNLLVQSNTFSTNWGTSSATITGGQSGYDGSSDAWLLDSSSEGYLFQYVTSSNVGTLSIYAKANSVNNLRLRTFGASINAEGFFDLENGVVGSSTNLVDLSIESIGGGWYRCSVVYDNAPSLIRIYPSVSSSTSSGTIGSVYIQDAMLNEGLVAQPYIETTTTAVYEGITDDVPRVDYSGGGCPSLLLEPQRTNLLTDSEYFGSWSLNAGGISSIEPNYSVSPEGLQNAYKVNFVVQGDSDLALRKGHLVTGGATYAYSIYIKGEGSNIGKDVVIKSKRSGGDSAGTTTFQTLTDEWVRIDFTTTYAANNTAANFYISSNDATSVLVWGAQAELGSYSTSYLPTYGTSTTRVQDSCYKTGISELIGQTEGTMFFEGSVEHTPENVSIMNFDRSTVFSIVLIKQTNDKINALVYNGGSSLFSIVSTAISGKFKCAIAYKSGDTAFYVNGTQIGVNTTTFTPAAGLDDIYIGSYSSPYFAYDHPVECNQALLFKTRLSNEELAILTK